MMRNRLINPSFFMRLGIILRRVSSVGNVSGEMIGKHAPKHSPIAALQLSDFIVELCNPSHSTEKFQHIDLTTVKSEQKSALNYWSSMEFPPNTEELTPKLAKQFGRDVARMDTGRLAQLLVIMAEKNVRHDALFQHIGTQLNLKPPKGSLLIKLVVESMARLTFLDDKLISKLKRQFIENLKTGNMHQQHLPDSIFGFGFLHISDQRFWREVIQCIELKIAHPYFKKNLTSFLNAFSASNVDSRLVRLIIEKCQQVADRSQMTPRNWLNKVHTFAILKGLTISLAESVLNKSFLEAIEKQQREEKLANHTIYYDHMRLENISNAAKLELVDYSGPQHEVGRVGKEVLETIRQIKYGTMKQPMVTEFGLMLRLVAPLKLHSTEPEWHHSSGAILEGRCFVDSERRQFIPLRELANGAGQGEKRRVERKCTEVAILFFTENHLTRIFDPQEDVGGPRLLGMYQMHIRHLKAANLHPIVFVEDHFHKLGHDERAKVDFIRTRILNLSEEFHENDWPNQLEDEDNNNEWIRSVLNEDVLGQ